MAKPARMTSRVNPNDLRLRVASHLVEDLGLNLYTSLGRVLVEYVANAYDADSPMVTIKMDLAKIQSEAIRLKELHRAQTILAKAEKRRPPRSDGFSMGDDIAIVIEDRGAGMTCADLQEKFLVAGRRRRGMDNADWHTPRGRLLMGRKGLGKLAGFGVAQSVRITTRCANDPDATQVELRYQEMATVAELGDVPVHGKTIKGGAGLPKNGGTRVELRNLLFEPMSVEFEELAESIARHFSAIEPADFKILICGKPLPPVNKDLEWGWPNPDLPLNELVESSYDVDGEEFTFKYRLRFKSRGKALRAEERGVRVYAHNRLVASPSLFRSDTNIHGFHMSDYLDGVVHADFLDEQPSDYVATNRQGLRWESPLLAPLRQLLSEEIKTAVKERYKVFEAENRKQTNEDPFTSNLIINANLSKTDTTVVKHIATILASKSPGGIADNEYRNRLTEIVGGLGRGKLFSTLKDLADEDAPEMTDVVAAVSKLTAEQLDSFYRFVRGRVHGIEALRKIVQERIFAANARKNEQTLHELLAQNTWLIDPRYFQYVTSNKTEGTLFHELEKLLKIGKFVPRGYNPESSVERKADGINLRPDLVFIVGSVPLEHIVIVELKAPNIPLVGAHFQQLQGYVYDVEDWLKQNDREGVRVTGILVGSMEEPTTAKKKNDRRWLEREVLYKLEKWQQYKVKSIPMLLEDAENANKELLQSWQHGIASSESGAAHRVPVSSNRNGIKTTPKKKYAKKITKKVARVKSSVRH
jgi:hypothetical protein